MHLSLTYTLCMVDSVGTHHISAAVVAGLQFNTSGAVGDGKKERTLMRGGM